MAAAVVGERRGRDRRRLDACWCSTSATTSCFEVAGGGRTVGKRAVGPARRDGRRRAGRAAREPDPQPDAADRRASGCSTSRRSISALVDQQQPAPRRPGRRHARGPRGRRRRAAVHRRARRRRSRPSATRAGTSRRSATTSRPPCARSWSGAANSTRARAPRSPRSWRGGCARWSPACGPGLTDETFLEHLAAAKARGRMHELARTLEAGRTKGDTPRCPSRTNRAPQATARASARRPQRSARGLLARASPR